MPESSALRINTVVTWTLVGVVLVAAALTLLGARLPHAQRRAP